MVTEDAAATICRKLGRPPPWKTVGKQTDRNCDTTESDAEQPITRGRADIPQTGLREPEKVCQTFESGVLKVLNGCWVCGIGSSPTKTNNHAFVGAEAWFYILL